MHKQQFEVLDDPEPSGSEPIPSISQHENYHPYLYQVPPINPAVGIISVAKELMPEPMGGDEWAFRREREIGRGVILTLRDIFVTLKAEDKQHIQKEIDRSGIVDVEILPKGEDVDCKPEIPAGLYSVRRSSEKDYSIIRHAYNEETGQEHEHAVDEDTVHALLALLHGFRDKQSI